MSVETLTARELAHAIRGFWCEGTGKQDDETLHCATCNRMAAAFTAERATTRATALEEAAELVEGEPYGESVHTTAGRIRALKTG